MVYIVIPVFNRWEFTKQCLYSLSKQTYLGIVIVVVDHGSSDGTHDNIRKEFPEVIVLKGDASMWWTASTNLGVKFALDSGAEFILTLNNDLSVNPDYIESLILTSSLYPKSLIGSINIDSNNKERVVFAGTKWNNHVAKYRNAISLSIPYSLIKKEYSVSKTDLLPGRGVLIPSDAFRKLGLYDVDHFPHYAADEDFSRRCVKNGYKLFVCISAPVYSVVDATGLKNIHKRKSLKYFVDMFFSIRSPNKLSVRWYWALKHGKFPIFYFLCDLTRIIVSQFIKFSK